MSTIDLAVAKQFLDVIHTADDTKLQMLLDGAEDEALQFMDRSGFGSLCPCDSDCESEPSSESEPGIPNSVTVGVLLLLQASYQATPDEIPKLRAAAEVKLMPYRCRLGV